MEKKDLNKGRFTFVTKKELGECKHCKELVFDNQLYVEENQEVSHYSCHNESKSK